MRRALEKILGVKMDTDYPTVIEVPISAGFIK